MEFCHLSVLHQYPQFLWTLQSIKIIEACDDHTNIIELSELINITTNLEEQVKTITSSVPWIWATCKDNNIRNSIETLFPTKEEILIREINKLREQNYILDQEIYDLKHDIEITREIDKLREQNYILEQEIYDLKKHIT